MTIIPLTLMALTDKLQTIFKFQLPIFNELVFSIYLLAFELLFEIWSLELIWNFSIEIVPNIR